MSTKTQRLLVIAAASGAVSGGLFAQPRPPSAEEQLRQQIAELQTETGLARPAELLDPLRALAVLYEEGEAVNRGLDLLGEDDLLVIHADKVPGTLAIVRERAVQGA